MKTPFFIYYQCGTIFTLGVICGIKLILEDYTYCILLLVTVIFLTLILKAVTDMDKEK